ncbi:nucleotide exchange factor GrpE [Halovulum sp. GXIMD14794]
MGKDQNVKMDDETFLDDPEALAAEQEAAEAAELEAAAEAGEKAAAGASGAVEAEIEALKAERDELKDRLLRALAETENLRKRAERDRRDAELYGGVRLARDILSVHDNLGRALEAIDEDLRTQAGAVVEGIELTQKDLLAAFQKHKIEMIDPQPGDKFDPKLHEAMFEAPVPDIAQGCIIQVMATGFVIGDRLLRPAKVGVSSGAPA